MEQDLFNADEVLERFVKKVCDTGIVFGLENDEGFAVSSSDEYQDEDGEPLELICFWSEKTLANECKKEEWAEYKTSEIKLGDFIENWCTSMADDGLLIGTDFNPDMSGFEIDPLDLIVEICHELKNQKKTVKLENYKNVDDFLKEIESLNEDNCDDDCDCDCDECDHDEDEKK